MNKINRYIDHTLLKADAGHESIVQLCDEAISDDFYSVCINSYWIEVAKERLTGSNVRICSVVGFPLGASDLGSKNCEAENACSAGADELDMVINIAALKADDTDVIKNEIRGISDIAGRYGAIVKVILETALLNEEEIIRGCQYAKLFGADFVKTSTGFAERGASTEDVLLMRKTVGPDFGIKASGGIRTYKEALAMINAGADRLGCSNSVKIMQESDINI